MDIARVGGDALCPLANVKAKESSPSIIKLAPIRRVFISKFSGNGNRPARVEIGEVILRSIRYVVVDDLLHVLVVNIYRRDLELPIFMGLRCDIKISLLRGKRHGQAKSCLV